MLDSICFLRGARHLTIEQAMARPMKRKTAAVRISRPGRGRLGLEDFLLMNWPS